MKTTTIVTLILTLAVAVAVGVAVGAVVALTSLGFQVLEEVIAAEIRQAAKQFEESVVLELGVGLVLSRCGRVWGSVVQGDAWC